jgi:hypothetical protein
MALWRLSVQIDELKGLTFHARKDRNLTIEQDYRHPIACNWSNRYQTSGWHDSFQPAVFGPDTRAAKLVGAELLAG